MSRPPADNATLASIGTIDERSSAPYSGTVSTRGPAQPEAKVMTDVESVRQEIEKCNRGFVAASNRGDAAGVVVGYTEDARLR